MTADTRLKLGIALLVLGLMMPFCTFPTHKNGVPCIAGCVTHNFPPGPRNSGY